MNRRDEINLAIVAVETELLLEKQNSDSARNSFASSSRIDWKQIVIGLVILGIVGAIINLLSH